MPKEVRFVIICRMKNTIVFAMAVALAGAVCAVNPITAEGEFLSDPAPRVGPDGKLWVFGSRDESTRCYCSRGNDAYETTDLRTWKVHKNVFTSDSLPGVKVLYAPDAFYYKGAWRLFYCTPSRTYMEGIATSDKPEGPFTNMTKLSECPQIDPSIFRDDDGTLYYNWGQFALNGAVLKSDLSGLVPGTLHTGIIDEAGHHFHEGVQLFKRKGLYYLAYTDIKTDGTRSAARIGYSTSTKPFGPYTYRGVIVDNTGCDPKTWNDHGGLVEYCGKWYIFYHRSTNGSNTMRKACVEPITFDEQGLIRPVEMTSNGAEPPLDPFTTVEARLACLLSGNVRLVTFPDKQERLAEIHAGDTALWRYFNFTRAARAFELTVKSVAGGTVKVFDGRGTELGKGTIPPGDGKSFSTVKIALTQPMPAGIQTVKLAFACPAGQSLGEVDAWRFVPGDEAVAEVRTEGELRTAFASVATAKDDLTPAARVAATYAARCALMLPGGLQAVKPYTGAVAGFTLQFTDPQDRLAFHVAATQKVGAQILGVFERKGTHARELVIQPPKGLAAADAEVWDPRQGTWARPFVDAQGNVRVVFAPHATLFLVWPAKRSACAAVCHPLVGPEVPARVKEVVLTEKDGGKTLHGAGWIWHPVARMAVGFATVRTTFDVPAGPLTSAVLTFSCDNGGVVKLNGREIGRQDSKSASWKKLSVLADVRAALKPGRNVLEIRGENIIDGDAGVIASLDYVAGGKKMRVFTNERTWEASLDGKTFVKAWQAAAYGGGAWGRFDRKGYARQQPLKQWTQTDITFSFGAVRPAGRYVLVYDGLVGNGTCAVEVNGQFAGGCIGAPYQLDITRGLRAGQNVIRLSSGGVKHPRIVRLPPAEGPYDLRCEYQSEPLGVVSPRFFWKYAGTRPAKWRLEVSSRPDFGAAGIVYSGETAEHLYVEPKLKLAPFTRYWWRVCAGTQQAEGAFVSGIDAWTKPFFKRSWNWDPAEYWRARKQVELHGAKRVILAVTSRGCHKLFVNGRPASEGFGPNRSHIEDGILLAETYDVTALVKEGVNEFELLISDGWARFKTCKKESCVSIDGRAETANGLVVIDSTTPWLVSRTGLSTVGPWGWNFGGEHLTDVRLVTDECAGTPVKETFKISCDVSDRDAVAKEIRPISIKPSDLTGEWRIDMGEEFTGFVRLRLKGTKGQVAKMAVSDQAVLKCAFNQRYEYAFAGGDGVFENKLNWMAGRYLYLSGCERPSLDDVTGLSIGCVTRRTGDFTGDVDLSRVLALDTDTYIATTLAGVTMDCPHRERLGYGEASLSSMWGDGLPYFDSAAYYYAYLLKWASSQEPNGHIPHVSPDFQGGGGTFWSNFPIYALSDFWRLYPDARLRDVIRPVAEKWLDYLDAHTHNGILEKYEEGKFGCLGDWAYPDGVIRDWGQSREARFFNCCAYAWAIRQALALEDLVRGADRRQTLMARLRVVQQAIDREYYRDGLYISEDARYQVMGLVSGAAAAAGHAAETERAMLNIVEWKGYVDGGSPSFTTLLRVLCTTARGRELALRALRRRAFPGYLYFADEGYNTLPEYWNYDRNSRGSMIHTCFTGAAGTLMYGFAGFDVKGNQITVAPFLSSALPNFEAHLETLYGTLAIKVESVRGQKIAWVTCPVGCQGSFVGRDRQPLVSGLNRFVCE